MVTAPLLNALRQLVVEFTQFLFGKDVIRPHPYHLEKVLLKNTTAPITNIKLTIPFFRIRMYLFPVKITGKKAFLGNRIPTKTFPTEPRSFLVIGVDMQIKSLLSGLKIAIILGQPRLARRNGPRKAGQAPDQGGHLIVRRCHQHILVRSDRG